jgi:hypothetical protein
LPHESPALAIPRKYSPFFVSCYLSMIICYLSRVICYVLLVGS